MIPAKKRFAIKILLVIAFAALSAVMDDVQAVKKGDRNTQQNYNFRGIDAVINAVGPVQQVGADQGFNPCCDGTLSSTTWIG